MKVLPIRHSLFAGTETLSLSVYQPVAKRVLWGTVPSIGGGVKLRGRVWYPVKVLHIRHNLFAGTETLSLRLRANRHEEWGRPPFGGGVELGGRV